MPILFGRLWAILGLAALCATALPVAVWGESPRAGAWRLDLGAEATKPLAEGLRQDLGPLLEEAHYRRGIDGPAAPDHRIVSLDRIVAALRAHRGLAWVALGERENGGAEVNLEDLYEEKKK
jgi:hypothetical protein